MKPPTPHRLSLASAGLAILSFLILPSAAAVQPDGKPQKLTSPEEVPVGLVKSEWSSIRAAYEAGQHAFHATNTGWQAQNPGQHWITKFDGRGFVAEPKGGGWQWGLKLMSYGFAEEQTPISGPPAVQARGQRLSYQWDAAVQEWWVNDKRGLEHGFTVKERPGLAAAPSPLTFTLAVRGTLKPKITSDAQGVIFQNASGATVLNYAGLKVWDADGKTLASRFEVAGENRVRLLVEEHGARYPLTIDPLAQQAYLKASNTDADDEFGRSVAVSGDTVVIGAPYEDSNATGVNGNQADNSAAFAGAAYVFVRSGTTWTQQAYLKASNTDANDKFGTSVTVSGDTVVVGAPGESSRAAVVGGTQSDNTAPGAGAAYVFKRVGSTWTQQAFLKANNAHEGEFGYSVSLSGDTVLIGSPGEDTDVTGVWHGDAVLDLVPYPQVLDGNGAAYVFTRSGSAWTQQAMLKASILYATFEVGWSVALSGDTAVIGVPHENYATTGVNGAVSGFLNWSGAALVFTRSGGTWSQQAYLKASNTGADDEFGYSVAVSGDTVVVGARQEDSNATGVNGDQANDSATYAGAAYVFTRSGGLWSQQAYLKASIADGFDEFGCSVAVTGDIVVIGSYLEDSRSTGIDGNQGTGFASSYSNSGAAYIFKRSGNTWAQHAYVKASNTGASDYFGWAVAASGDTAVIGAPREDSSAAGVNGDQLDNTDFSSGAAYIFNDISQSPVPVVSGVFPASGSIAGGTNVTIGGAALSGATAVAFGGIPATNVNVIDSTAITCTTPAHAAGSVSVIVTTAGGTNVANSFFTYVDPTAPTVTAVSPNNGSPAGGTSITITGTNFTGVTGVTIGGTAATNVSVVNDTTITCTTPPGNAGSASVLVTTSVGSTSANTLFTYILSVGLPVALDTPGLIYTQGGNGDWFGQTDTTHDAVDAGQSGAIGDSQETWFETVVAGSGDLSFWWKVSSEAGYDYLEFYIDGVLQAGQISGEVDWEQKNFTLGTGTHTLRWRYIKDGSSSSGSDAAWVDEVVCTSAPLPVVTEIFPDNGLPAGGNAVNIGGINFTGATGVTFGGTAATNVNVLSDSIISCTAPAHAAGTVSVQVTTPNGTSATNSLYTYVIPVPTVSAITPNTGSTAGGTVVTITGTFFDGITGVTIGGVAATDVGLISPTSLFCTTPAHAAGSASVIVTNIHGSNAANTLYTYVAAPTVTAISPNRGSIEGGTSVTITGANLTGATGVTFGGTAATNVNVVNSTTVTCITPAHAAGAVSVLVTNAVGTNAANTLFTYEIPAPDIAVAQGGSLTDAVGSVSFGSLPVGSSSGPLTFTITNPGTAELTDLAVSKSGPHAADFTVSALSATSIPVGTDTVTFTVTFSPGSGGARSAALHITSDLTGPKNPFDIGVSGSGSVAGKAAQTIVFTPPAKLNLAESPLTLTASASSGLPVTFSLVSGPATLAGNVLTFTAKGAVKVRAIQAGNDSYLPAIPVDRTITAAANPTSLTLTNLSQTYTGTPRPIAVLGTGGAVEVTYKVGLNFVSEPPTNAGSYAVKATVGSTTKTGTLVITKAPLFVQPDDQRRLIGQENPVLGFSYSGFLDDDNAANSVSKAPVIATTAKAASPGGLYPITASGGTSANYLFIYMKGTMKIETFAASYEAMLMAGDPRRPAAKLELTVAATSKTFSAKLTTPTETAALSLPGTLTIDTLTETATGTAAVTKGGSTYLVTVTLPLTGDFTAEAKRNGTLLGDATNGRKLLTLAKGQTLSYIGAHSALLAPAAAAAGVPAGAGWAVATIDAKGLLKLVGKLADGSGLTASLAADGGSNPGYRLFLQPYTPARAGAYIAGTFALKPHPDLPGRRIVAYEDAADLTWVKAPRLLDTSYRAGFGPVDTRFTLDPWLPPSAAKSGVPAITLAQRLGLTANQFTAQHSTISSASFGNLPTTLGLSTTNAVSVIAPATTPANSTKWKVTITPATGAFVGSFELMDGGKKRVVPFAGVMRQPPDSDTSGLIGDGSFQLPSLLPAPDNEILSGEVGFER